MIDGWFPKINSKGEVASGSSGIWVDGKKVSEVGTSPFWIKGSVLCFNRNDGSTQVGDEILPKAFNEYYGSETEDWTGFEATGAGRVGYYKGATLYNQGEGLTLAKYAGYGSIYGFNLAYLAPYQSENRTLVYNNIPIVQDKLTNYQMSLNGILAYQIATSTYNREIRTQGQKISIRKDEDPISVFEHLGQSWLLTQTQIGQLVYPFGSFYGYFLKGDLFYPDCRVLNNKLKIVGSSSKGEPISIWLDFNSPRQDLRLI